MNLPPLLLPGTSVSPNKDIYQFGNILKEGERAIIESVEPDNFFHLKDERGYKFSVSLTEINLFSVINCNDNRPKVNMDICLPGQVLISKHGKKFVFIGKNLIRGMELFPYIIQEIEDFSNGTDLRMLSRTIEGWTYKNKPFETDHDIVEIKHERVFTFEQVKTFLEENSYVLTDEGLATYKVECDENGPLNKNLIELFLCEEEEEIVYQIKKEKNPIINLFGSSFFVYIEDESFQFQILTVKTNF